MREILNIQIGQCGNAIGTQFWDVICSEHGINESGSFIGNDQLQLNWMNVHFNETKGLRYSPRSIMIDLDRNSMDKVRSSPFGAIFKADNFIFGNGSTGNIWAKGHLTEGVELCDIALNKIRKEVEACDYFHGFQIIHSLGGGTGSGLGSLLVNKIRDEYKDRMITTYSIAPSFDITFNDLEPYNAVLTINHLIEHTHETYCMDNDALFDIVSEELKSTSGTFNDINYLVAQVMSAITCCMRFPGPSNADFRKIAVNMVPFPRLHFFLSGYAPILNKSCVPYRKLTFQDVSSQLFHHKNTFAKCDTRKGMFLTVACIFRGAVSPKEVDKQISNLQNKNSSRFVEWIPDNVKTAICGMPPSGLNLGAILTSNSTSLQALLGRIRENFLAMFKRKYSLHWYTGEGMEELEFEMAEANVNDLINDYQEHEINAFDKKQN